MSRAARIGFWFAAALLAFAAAAAGSADSARSLAANAAATSVGLACLALGGALFSDEPVGRRLGWVPSGLPPTVLFGLVLGMLATSQLAEWAIDLAGYRDVGNLAHFRHVLAGVRQPPDLLAATVGLALLPGVAEELALRGWIQRGLERRVAPAVAVVATALVFGLLHGEPVHAAGACALGLYLGSVVALCGSIRPAVLCHVVNNLAATLGTALGLEAFAAPIVVLGAVAGPWALWRTALQRTAARPPLGGTPEPPGPQDADRGEAGVHSVAPGVDES